MAAVPLEARPAGKFWTVKGGYLEREGIRGSGAKFLQSLCVTGPLDPSRAGAQKAKNGSLGGETALGAVAVTNRGDAAAMVA